MIWDDQASRNTRHISPDRSSQDLHINLSPCTPRQLRLGFCVFPLTAPALRGGNMALGLRNASPIGGLRRIRARPSSHSTQNANAIMLCSPHCVSTHNIGQQSHLCHHPRTHANKGDSSSNSVPSFLEHQDDHPSHN